MFDAAIFDSVIFDTGALAQASPGGGSIGKSYYWTPGVKKKNKIAHYDEQELVRLIKKDAREKDEQASQELIRLAQNAANAEAAVIQFQSAFSKARADFEKQVHDQIRLQKLKVEMAEEQDLIFMILMEVI